MLRAVVSNLEHSVRWRSCHAHCSRDRRRAPRGPQ
jgi:hypothetical protein